MVTLSYLEWVWLIWTTGIGVTASIVALTPKCSSWIRELVVYGKSCAISRHWVFGIIEVPKRWFTHFYIIASVWSTICSWYLFQVYVLHSAPPDWLSRILKEWSLPRRSNGVDPFSICLTMGLLVVHTYRRLNESLFTSVYSDTKMNILHYALGCVHYALLPLCVLAEAPGFVSNESTNLTTDSLNWRHTVGLALFFYASYKQHRCLEILGGMRRNYLGNITTYAHGIPTVDWFEWVSCPHFLFEILIYVAMYFTLAFRHNLWCYVMVFVVTNQVLAALITHRWYVEKFGRLYPTDRKALIPYLL